MAEQRQAPRNWAEARARIDRGETGDKIAAEDPAAAPLGTDAEARSPATPSEDIANSAAQQGSGEAARAMAAAPRIARRRQLAPWLVAVVVVAVIAAAALLIAA